MTDFFQGRRRRYISPFPLYLIAFSLSFVLADVHDPSELTFCTPDDIDTFGGWLCEHEKKLGPGGLKQLDQLITDYKVGEVVIPFIGSLVLLAFWKNKKFIEHFFFLVTSITAINIFEIFFQVTSLVSPVIKESYVNGFASDLVMIYFPIWFYYAAIRAYYGDSVVVSISKAVFVWLIFYGAVVGLFLVSLVVGPLFV